MPIKCKLFVATAAISLLAGCGGGALASSALLGGLFASASGGATAPAVADDQVAVVSTPPTLVAANGATNATVTSATATACALGKSITAGVNGSPMVSNITDMVPADSVSEGLGATLKNAVNEVVTKTATVVCPD